MMSILCKQLEGPKLKNHGDGKINVGQQPVDM